MLISDNSRARKNYFLRNRYDFLYFCIKNLKTCYDPSLEPSHQDGSNEGSQIMFFLRNEKNYHKFILRTPPYLDLCLEIISISHGISISQGPLIIIWIASSRGQIFPSNFTPIKGIFSLLFLLVFNFKGKAY